MDLPGLVIRGGGVEFFGQTPPSGAGFVIAPDGLDGLDDGVSVRGEVVQRQFADGDYDLPTTLDARIVQIAGGCIANSPGQLAWFKSALKGMFGGASGPVTFEHLGSTVWGVARMAPSTRPNFKVDGTDSLSAAFSIQLKFPDPFLYGETRTFAGGTPALHYGNWKAIPVHVVSGVNASGYTINGPGGRQFKVAKPVTSGSPHTIDMRTGWLTINGVVQTGAVTIADLWSIPAGGQVTHTLTGSGLTLATTVKDTNN